MDICAQQWQEPANLAMDSNDYENDMMLLMSKSFRNKDFDDFHLSSFSFPPPIPRVVHNVNNMQSLRKLLRQHWSGHKAVVL